MRATVECARALALCVSFVALVACTSSGGTQASTGTQVADRAISTFAAQPESVTSTFDLLNSLALTDPGNLRASALRHLSDANPNARYAAIYSLSIVAAPGAAQSALHGLLASKNLSERLRAAAGLLSIGDKSAFPTVIDALTSTGSVAYEDPPQAGWEDARRLLLQFTDRDFGLRQATVTAEQAAASQPAWQHWWNGAGSSVTWNGGALIFRTTS
jgi:hypothetical protein